ncbi:MAG: hypothetical protein ISEC1_P1065 [Thiomicrorhabdus sp.]|nr:MAG: hypothetical protein ISEC1_P1065 [Thiomicrorhabdus sp.]
MKYTWIYNNSSQDCISRLCKFSDIKRISYYSWLEAKQVNQANQDHSLILIEDHKLKTLIPKVFKEYKGHGGTRRIKNWLMKTHDLKVSRKRITT